MIVNSDAKLKPLDVELGLPSEAGPSDIAPPPFDDGQVSTDFTPESDPPPPFSPYVAEFFENSSGDIISHDAHLNNDGEALYRFLLEQSASNPTLVFHIRGTHQETRWRTVTTRDNNGRTTTRQESYTETVVDFDFKIDVGQHIIQPAVQFTLPDSIPAYRGRMFKEIEPIDGVVHRRASRAELKALKRWVKERDAKGLPPWQGWSSDAGNAGFLRSSKTVRRWCDEYTASDRILKEFCYEKIPYGWNIEQIQQAIHTMITHNCLYQGDIKVDFEKRSSKIFVRPTNRLSTALSRTWVKVLLMIFLIYPFIWLFKRYHRRGGGQWAVGGGAYALNRWVPVGPERQAELLSGSPAAEGEVLVQRRSDGLVLKAAGQTETQWLGTWRRTISYAVQNRYQSTTPLLFPPQASEQREGFALPAIDQLSRTLSLAAQSTELFR